MIELLKSISKYWAYMIMVLNYPVFTLNDNTFTEELVSLIFISFIPAFIIVILLGILEELKSQK